MPRIVSALLLATACTSYVETPSVVSDTGRTPPGYDATCTEGTHCNPLLIDALPFVASGDTRDSTERHIDLYDCGSSDEAGAEVWYAVDLLEPGLLIASIDEVSGDGVDVDVHILTDTTPESCLARDNAATSAQVPAGFAFVVVDTWRSDSGTEYPGPYTLSVDFVPDPSGDDDDDDTPDTSPVDSADDTGTVATGPCPADMVAIEDYCIDRYEAHLDGQDPYQVPTGGVAANALGAIPQGYISGEVAELACEAAGKRLCSSDEWLRACEGPSGNTYPYGDTYDADACNADGRYPHPIVEVFGGNAQWNTTEMNDPLLNQLADGLAPSGAYDECVTDEGVYDMHGNLHEWVADSSGVFRGGFYVDASINGTGCSYRTTRHTFDYHDYSTGFRCCADAE